MNMSRVKKELMSPRTFSWSRGTFKEFLPPLNSVLACFGVRDTCLEYKYYWIFRSTGSSKLPFVFVSPVRYLKQ